MKTWFMIQAAHIKTNRASYSGLAPPDSVHLNSWFPALQHLSPRIITSFVPSGVSELEEAICVERLKIEIATLGWQ